MSLAHSRLEDVMALLTGCTLAALGVFFLNQAHMVSGGTVGLALLLTQATSLPFAVWFVGINLPFLLLAQRRMGWRFTLRSCMAVGLVALLSQLLHRALYVAQVTPLCSASLGGLLIGIGLLILFRHQASLGGFNILALWFQQRFAIPAGKVQMVLDASIVVASLYWASAGLVVFSVLSVVLLNLVLVQNHRPGRYLGAR